jgi:hypothetical protein
MNKFTNRIITEFEDVLLKLSKNINTTYDEAIKEAEKYSEEFSKRKNLSSADAEDVYILCVELVGNWFPDTTNLNYASFR